MGSAASNSPSPVGHASGTSVTEQSPANLIGTFVAPDIVDQEDEFKLDVNPSLVIIIVTNILMHLSMFIIVASSNAYAAHLGGSPTFSGLVIGIPTAFSGLTLIPLMRRDRGQYSFALHFSCATLCLGSILYGLAYKAQFLYLILIGRIVQGLGYSFFMYSKRYCSDPRVVGIRRRTSLAAWLVVGQGCGISAGPFFGGLLYKIGFGNEIFNGYTSPGWVMAGIFLIHWVVAALFFKDIPLPPSLPQPQGSDKLRLETPSLREIIRRLDKRQWGVVVTMCWFAMTCFFMLGAWQSNVPIFSSTSSDLSPGAVSATISLLFNNPADRMGEQAHPKQPFHWSPFASGNFLALGGICIFPFLFLNMFFTRRTQDRHILALGSGIGLTGLLLTVALIAAQPSHGSLTFWTFFVCWFLVALGFNLATTSTLSLLSKQLPPSWNGKTSMAIQYSNYAGRVCGSVWGGSGLKVGMLNYLGLQIAIVGIGAVLFTTLWKELKAKTG